MPRSAHFGLASRLVVGVVLAALLMLPIGCRLFEPVEASDGKSPLRPFQTTPHSLAMEIIWARCSCDDRQLNETMWQEIDETKIDPAVRRELAENGFRVGVVGGTLPEAIAEALKVDTIHPEEPAEEEQQLSTLLAEPQVRSRVMRLRRGRRSEIQASEVYAVLPLLTNREGELSGHTYREAQAMYALQIEPQSDRSVRVELTPELHFGKARLRWTGGDEGILRQAPLRDREVYERLRMEVSLHPGEMLVLMSLPNATSRLGHYFHAVDGPDGQQQKLIIFRTAEVPASDTFAE